MFEAGTIEQNNECFTSLGRAVTAYAPRTSSEDVKIGPIRLHTGRRKTSYRRL